MAFLVLHVVGLGAVIIMSLFYGAWDLALINGVVFVVLLRLEMVLCRARYTAPMPVYADGNVGTAQPREAGPAQPECVAVQPQIIDDTVLAAA